MTDQSQLEQRYRRLLRLYPRGFRREHEEEMLVVLLACARNGRRHGALADSANLLWHALWTRVRPVAPRSLPTVFWGVRLIVLAAVLELVAVLTVIATQSAVQTAAVRGLSRFGAAHLANLLDARVASVEIGGPIAAAAWLTLAWANDRGYRWARVGMLPALGLTLTSLLAAVGQHAAAYAAADLDAGIVLCLVAAAATLLIIATDSNPHYDRPRSGSGRRRGPRLRGSAAAWPDVATWN